MAIHTTHKDRRESVTADRAAKRHASRVDAHRDAKRAGTKSSRDYTAARWDS